MSEMSLQTMRLPPLFPMEPDTTPRNYGDGDSYTFRLDRETMNSILMEKLNREPAIISIRGSISEATADYVRKAIDYLDLKYVEKKKKLKPGNIIRVDSDINTFGGYVFSSFGIATRFFESGYFVSGLISEYGMSGGGLILQGCHHRAMHENAQILVHNSHALAIESEHSLEWFRTKKRKEDYKRDNDRIINWIARRIALTNHEKTVADREKELRKLFIKERRLYPDEAMYYGLIDEIVENFPRDIPAPAKEQEVKGDKKSKSISKLEQKQTVLEMMKQTT